MSRNQQKYTLLDKKIQKSSGKLIEKQQEWIELEDLRSNPQQPRYYKLEDDKNKSFDPPKSASNRSSRINQESGAVLPLIDPTYSIVDHPNTIKLNGVTFQEVGNAPPLKIKSSKIPLMKTVCQSCGTLQQVPGNSTHFICGTCENVNQCQPIFGIFRCGSCETKVFYKFEMTDYIRCTKCGTVNKVPRMRREESKPVKPRLYSREEEELMSERSYQDLGSEKEWGKSPYPDL